MSKIFFPRGFCRCRRSGPRCLPLLSQLFAALLVFGASCARGGEPASEQHAAPLEHTLVGQVLLPSGEGSRGVELRVTITASSSEPRVTWVLFDEEGRFSHTFRGRLTSVSISAGIRAEVHKIDAAELPEAGSDGQIDVGVIDLREELVRHRLFVREAEGTLPGDVRVAMWFGPPPVGPKGEPVSLGSRQFPPIVLGREMEWLLPHEADSVYFLVERPADSARGTKWRSGRQRLFGPFTTADLPAELIMD